MRHVIFCIISVVVASGFIAHSAAAEMKADSHLYQVITESTDNDNDNGQEPTKDPSGDTTDNKDNDADDGSKRLSDTGDPQFYIAAGSLIAIIIGAGVLYLQDRKRQKA